MFRVTANIARDSEKKILAYVHKNITRLWMDCVREFVLAAASRIVVDTGMSMASLAPLAGEVRRKTIILAAAQGNGPGREHKGITDGRFTDNNGMVRSISSGELLGRQAYDIRLGSRDKWELFFEFHIVVWQHYLHESGENFIRSSGWESLQAGIEAFEEHWSANSGSILGDRFGGFFFEGDAS